MGVLVDNQQIVIIIKPLAEKKMKLCQNSYKYIVGLTF